MICERDTLYDRRHEVRQTYFQTNERDVIDRVQHKQERSINKLGRIGIALGE
jgi:hypothetical protein